MLVHFVALATAYQAARDLCFIMTLENLQIMHAFLHTLFALPSKVRSSEALSWHECQLNHMHTAPC